MGFAVSPDAYDRFMGRYSTRLAPRFAAFAGVSAGQRVLDVGCGPGALTSELVGRLGAEAVAAVDPSDSFVPAVRERCPGVDVRQATAEDLPFDDDHFDVALGQLVVHFMSDPVAGLREMARVTRAGGVVAACVWDHVGSGGPLSLFWEVARELDPSAPDEAPLAGAGEGQLAQLLREAGLDEVDESTVAATVEHPTFEDWWEPFMLGVGPAGAYVAGLPPDRREQLAQRLREALPSPPFEVTAVAWAARATVPPR